MTDYGHNYTTALTPLVRCASQLRSRRRIRDALCCSAVVNDWLVSYWVNFNRSLICRYFLAPCCHSPRTSYSPLRRTAYSSFLTRAIRDRAPHTDCR